MTARRILFVCIQNSPHVAGWVNHLAKTDFDIHYFPIESILPPNEALRLGTLHWPVNSFARILLGRPNFPGPVKTRRFIPQHVNWGEALRPNFLTRTRPASEMHGPTALADLIRKLQPDLIHSMEFQHCAYTALAAKEALGGAFPPWIALNWGSDIFLFGREPEHRKKIEQVLTGCDYYSAECHRDLELATQLGLKGKIVGTIPNCGGIDLRIASPLRRKKLPSARRLILVKGYEHFAGRALTALSVLETLKEELRDYEVVVFSASPATMERVAKLADETLNIRVIDTVPHSLCSRPLPMRGSISESVAPTGSALQL